MRRAGPAGSRPRRTRASAGSRGLLHIGLGATTDDPDYAALRAEFLNRYEQEIAVHSRLFDGMPELLAWLEANGIRWGVISNKLEYLVRRLVQQLGLGHRVALAYGGDTAPRAQRHGKVAPVRQRRRERLRRCQAAVNGAVG